ncbi:hypothetical protein S1OALGB6SA_2108 [Olavius algarvensis spirochete endosymbiont]|uniref:hypothetical protein n=1 Tax=Olavius algarvensis spirochete endosymbiont TaxID=260710 RepID=UPI000F2B0172|nr:hypothetical protein [Olavius algarvensis spirochete endosymbiont]VDB01014.1 hypothetical protein S1OALGB6SA_2108 [Olavius algarvensis spirochete endosymbiont]
MGKKLIISLACVSALFLTSCLRLETIIRLKKNGAVTTRLVYVIAPEMVDFGRSFGSDEPWPLPLTEKDFKQQALRVGGVVVVRYRTHKLADGSERIDVKIVADSFEDISNYLALDFDIERQGERGSLIFTLPDVDDYEKADTERREILDAFAEKSTFRFSFKPPAKPISVLPGEIDGRTASFEISLWELLYNKAPKTWEVHW